MFTFALYLTTRLLSRSSYLIHFSLFSVSLLYGLNYSILKSITPDYLPAFGFIVFRVLLAGIVFWIMDMGSSEKVNWKNDGLLFFLCAITGVSANQLFFFKGVSLTSVVNSSLLMTLSPIFVYITTLIMLRKSPVWHKSIGFFLGVLGAILLVLSSTKTIAGNTTGDLFIILNGLSYAIYLVLVKGLTEKYRTATITKWIFTIGFLFVLPVGWAEAINIEWSQLTANGWIAFSYVILAATVAVYFLNAWSMKKVSPEVVGIYIYLQPVIATLTAWVFRGENFNFWQVIAAGLVFFGIYLVTIKK